MAVFGITMVRDEAEIIGHTISHMLEEVDEVIVADNLSTDDTRQILAELPITIIDDTEPGYYQSAKMTHLAGLAREHGATWVVPFDADEWWRAPTGRLGTILDKQDDATVATATVYDHVATARDLVMSSPFERLPWRRHEPLPLPKVACRALDGLTIGQGNHTAHYPQPTTIAGGLLEVHHFGMRSPEQFIRKVRNGAAAYAATTLPDDMGAHWRDYGRLLDHDGPDTLADVFRTHFWTADPERDLVYDPVT